MRKLNTVCEISSIVKVKIFLYIFFCLYYRDLWFGLGLHGDIIFIQGRVGGTLEGQKEMMKREKTEGRKTLEDFLSLLELNSLYYSLFLEHLS